MTTICIKEVDVEYVKKGKNGWHQATVSYTDEKAGKDFVKKLMSFKNPKVFGIVQEAKEGERYDVEVKKEGDYYEWVAIEKSTGKAAAAAPAAQRTSGTWETPEERARKQVYIVKQSSITNAIALLGAGASVADVLATAQSFVDYVFDDEASSLDGEVAE